MSTALLPALPLVDGLGRIATDLRVSLTDRCNLRCGYCMPDSGPRWLDRATILTDDEVIRLIGVGVNRLGIAKLRFTGGEPLLRRGLPRILAACAAMRTAGGHPPELSLTTNGTLLEKHAETLARAGLQRVNISLDSLDDRRYALIARRDQLDSVLRGLAAAASAGLRPLKVNTVVMRGRNESDVVPLTGFCLRGGYQLRFIEQMPLGPVGAWDPASMIRASEVVDLLREHFELTPVARRTSAPATEWQVAGSACHPSGTIGVIASVSEPFCDRCDRTRLTPDGQLRACLFSDAEVDLRGAMRSGADDAELAELWRRGHLGKPAGHGIGTAGFRQPERGMSAIGG